MDCVPGSMLYEPETFCGILTCSAIPHVLNFTSFLSGIPRRHRSRDALLLLGRLPNETWKENISIECGEEEEENRDRRKEQKVSSRSS